jgi:hypothetical protein
MTTKNEGREGADDDLALAVRELQAAADAAAARRAQRREATNSASDARKRIEMALLDARLLQKLQIVDEAPGFDPYNSGSFDRRNSWSRLGERHKQG